jgi:serine/threonine protein kinase
MSVSTPTIADFLETVRKSGLVEDARLEEATAAWPDRTAPLPDELVQSLIDDEVLTKWQTDQLRKGRHKGFVLGKYRLLRLIGAGGMSSVYLAEHTTLQSKVAIKVLPIKRVDQSSYLARFEREAQTSARLSHPNIVRAFDLDTSGSIHFIVMEFVDGVDLHAKVKQDGPLPLRQAVDYTRQAALGLQHAHEEGLVHRDIKPANLILDARGTVKILDLGLAFAKGEDDTSLTQEHGEKVLGTADYLSPEQARDSHKADARSDIYALGCTFHYLLTGRPPFAKGSLAERIQAHLRTPPPNLLDERSDTPPALVELYFRMMEKHPEGRPQTAGEVAASLAAWLATNDQANLQGRPEPPRRAPPRRTPAPGSGAAGGVPGGRGQGGSGIAAPGRPPSGAPLRSPGGSGPLPFNPAAGPSRSSLPMPQPVRKGGSGSSRQGSGGSGIRLDVGAPAAPGKAAAHHGHQQKQPASRFAAPLGIPIAAWIAVAAGLLLAAYLGWQVMQPKPAKKKPENNNTNASPPPQQEDATQKPAQNEEPQPEPDGKKVTKPAGEEPKKAPVVQEEDELSKALKKALEESKAPPEPAATDPDAAKPDAAKPDAAKPDAAAAPAPAAK